MADLKIAVQLLGEDRASGPIGKVSASLKGLGGAAKQGQGLVGGLVGGLGQIGLAGLGVRAVADGVAGLGQALFGAAMEAEQVARQTEAVLVSTGGAAGMSADAIADLAGKLSKLTPFEDEAIQSAENLLLTFTSIGSDVFPTATETVLNMSQALGQDLKSSAIQLGKALQDPITGATALRRVGVNLSDAQQELIKSFVKAGDLASAQGVILKELETEFGQAAVMAGQTFGGQLKIAQTQLGNVQEAIGGAVLPAVTDLLKAFSGFLALDEVQGAISGLAGLLAGGVKVGLETLIGLLRDAWTALQPLRDAFMAALPGIQAFAATVTTTLSDLFSDIKYIFETGGKSGVESFLVDLTLATGDIASTLEGWARAFLAWIQPMIPPFLHQLGAFLGVFGGWLVGTALPAIVDSLRSWAGAMIDWIAPQIPGLLRELGGFLAELSGWLLGTALPAIVEHLAQWGAEFVAWIAPRLPPLLVELGKLLLELGAWMLGTALPAIVEKLAEWGAAFIDWIGTEVLPNLPGKLGEIKDALVTWLVETAIPWAAENLPRLGAQMVQGILDGLKDLAGKLMSTIGDAIRSIRLDIGPFHLSADGFRLDSPPPVTLTTIQETVQRVIQGRAHGGPVLAGLPYIVGEQRPELFVPDTNGTILPRVPGPLGGTVQHIYNVRVTPIRADMDERELGRTLRRLELLHAGMAA